MEVVGGLEGGIGQLSRIRGRMRVYIAASNNPLYIQHLNIGISEHNLKRNCYGMIPEEPMSDKNHILGLTSAMKLNLHLCLNQSSSLPMLISPASKQRYTAAGILNGITKSDLPFSSCSCASVLISHLCSLYALPCDCRDILARKRNLPLNLYCQQPRQDA